MPIGKFKHVVGSHELEFGIQHDVNHDISLIALRQFLIVSSDVLFLATADDSVHRTDYLDHPPCDFV